MGGSNEKTIPSAPTTVSGKTVSVGKIRIHGNAGEVHFHDDEKGLKVAIPVAHFWKCWTSNVNLNSLQFIDHERQTICCIHFRIINSGENVDANVIVRKINFDETFQKINDFVSGK